MTDITPYTDNKPTKLSAKEKLFLDYDNQEEESKFNKIYVLLSINLDDTCGDLGFERFTAYIQDRFKKTLRQAQYLANQTQALQIALEEWVTLEGGDLQELPLAKLVDSAIVRDPNNEAASFPSPPSYRQAQQILSHPEEFIEQYAKQLTTGTEPDPIKAAIKQLPNKQTKVISKANEAQTEPFSKPPTLQQTQNVIEHLNTLTAPQLEDHLGTHLGTQLIQTARTLHQHRNPQKYA